MYYIIAKENMDNGIVKRNIICVANTEGYTDLEDVSSIGTPSKVVLQEDGFNEILEHGYPTKEDALNDKEMMRDIEDYAGPWFRVEFTVVDEAELRTLYKDILDRK